MLSCRFSLDSGKYQGLFDFAMGILARITVLPKYKPWRDQSRSDIFPNRAKTCTITCNNTVHKYFSCSNLVPSGRWDVE